MIKTVAEIKMLSDAVFAVEKWKKGERTCDVCRRTANCDKVKFRVCRCGVRVCEFCEDQHVNDHIWGRA